MHLCIDVSTVTMGHYQLPRARYAVHLVSLKQKEKKHWRNFTLKSGGDQWRHQDLVSGGARRSRRQRVMYVEGCSLPSRLGSLGERRELPSGARAEPCGRYRIFCIF